MFILWLNSWFYLEALFCSVAGFTSQLRVQLTLLAPSASLFSCSHNNFVAILDLPEGEHQYKFFVDGQWTHDPSEVLFLPPLVLWLPTQFKHMAYPQRQLPGPSVLLVEVPCVTELDSSAHCQPVGILDLDERARRWSLPTRSAKSSKEYFRKPFALWFLPVCLFPASSHQPAWHSQQHHSSEENWLWSVWCFNGGFPKVLRRVWYE